MLTGFDTKDRRRTGREEAAVVREVGDSEGGGHDDELEGTEGEGGLEGGREGGRALVNTYIMPLISISLFPSLPPSLRTVARPSSSNARYFLSSSRAISFLSGKALR